MCVNSIHPVNMVPVMNRGSAYARRAGEASSVTKVCSTVRAEKFIKVVTLLYVYKCVVYAQIWTTAHTINPVPMAPHAWTRARAATPVPVCRASPGLTVTWRSGSVTASPVAMEATVWWVRKALSLLSHNTGFPVFVFAAVYLRLQEDAIDCQVSRWPSSQREDCK